MDFRVSNHRCGRMRKPRTYLLLSLLPVFSACQNEEDTSQAAQSLGETAETVPAATASRPEPIFLVRGSLRAVASAQEAYWREHKTYTTDLEALKQIPSCEISEGVAVRVVDASENGFATEATHPDFPGRSCVQWYGKLGAVEPVATTREGKRGDESPGRVVCEAP